MEKEKAIQGAIRLARFTGEIVYVLKESNEYEVATEAMLITFWSGVEPEYTVSPNGMIDYRGSGQ